MRIILLIVSFGFLLRLYSFFETQWVPVSDQRDYFTLAKNLYDGEGYIQIYNGESEQYQGMTLRAYRSPGYPIFLSSLFKVFSPSPRVGLLAQVFLDTGTLFLLMLLTQKLFGIKASALSGFLYSLNIIWTPLLITEPLFTFLLIFSVYCGFKIKQPSLITLLTMGCLICFLIFIRPIGLVMLAFLSFTWTLTPRGIAILTVPFLVVLSMWGYRNYLIFDEFVPITTNFGAHNAQDFGIDKVSEIKRLRSEGENEAQINSILTEEIISYIKDNPSFALQVYFQRIKNLFTVTDISEVSSLLLKSVLLNPYLKVTINSWLTFIPWIFLISSIPFLYQCVAGEHRQFSISLLILVISFVFLHGLISNGNLRFISPLLPIFLLFMGSIFSVSKRT